MVAFAIYSPDNCGDYFSATRHVKKRLAERKRSAEIVPILFQYLANLPFLLILGNAKSCKVNRSSTHCGFDSHPRLHQIHNLNLSSIVMGAPCLGYQSL
jgi:hypothetical protein